MTNFKNKQTFQHVHDMTNVKHEQKGSNTLNEWTLTFIEYNAQFRQHILRIWGVAVSLYYGKPGIFLKEQKDRI